jgi:hypothetical protein
MFFLKLANRIDWVLVFFSACEDNTNRKREGIIQKNKEEEKGCLKLKQKADKIISSTRNIEKITKEKLKLSLNFSKRNGDPVLPTKKKDMLELYEKKKDRKPREFSYPVSKVQVDVIKNDLKYNFFAEEINKFLQYAERINSAFKYFSS